MGIAEWLDRRLAGRMETIRQRYLRDFVFIHINKTGGTSIEKALGVALDHKTAMEKVRELGEARWRSKFTFASVRNPWDKVVSHYHYRVMTNQTGLGERSVDFSEWVRRAYRDEDPEYMDNRRFFMPQMDWITDEEGLVLVDYIARFENLGEDFELVRERLNLSRGLPHEKRSDRGDYRSYYDAESRAIVAERFAKDIEHFGYEF